MVGSSAISVEQMQEIQESSLVCERWCHRSFFYQNILRMTSDRNCLARQKNCQRSWSKKGLNCQSFCYGFLSFCILFRDHISSFNETCLFFVSLLLWNHEMFLSNGILTKYFDQTPTCKIKDNQSWRLKVFWLQKWLDAWKWHKVTKQFWTHTSWNWATHYVAKF
jgi:hypothetical protein